MVDRHLTWALLKSLSRRESLPWLVGGDFNEIMSANEKTRGVTRSEKQMDGFRESIAFCSLKDLHFIGPKFTWRGIRCDHEVKVFLDRFLASSRWSNIFHAARVLHLNPCNWDHLPILVEIRVHHARK